MEKPTKEQVRKWVKALRSGKYSQTTGTLQDDKGYCCLGVACRIFIPKHKLRLNEKECLQGGVPKDQYNAPEWLKEIDDTVNGITENSLVDMNDSGIKKIALEDKTYNSIYKKSFTFDEIADVLELVFIHEILNEN